MNYPKSPGTLDINGSNCSYQLYPFTGWRRSFGSSRKRACEYAKKNRLYTFQWGGEWHVAEFIPLCADVAQDRVLDTLAKAKGKS